MDAWQEHDEMLKRFTKEWEIRPDLKVFAPAHERAVVLQIRKRNEEVPVGNVKGRYSWTTVQRNVSTMRETANALLEACDFVERSNPKWAAYPGTVVMDAEPDGRPDSP